MIDQFLKCFGNFICSDRSINEPETSLVFFEKSINPQKLALKNTPENLEVLATSGPQYSFLGVWGMYYIKWIDQILMLSMFSFADSMWTFPLTTWNKQGVFAIWLVSCNHFLDKQEIFVLAGEFSKFFSSPVSAITSNFYNDSLFHSRRRCTILSDIRTLNWSINVKICTKSTSP